MKETNDRPMFERYQVIHLHLKGYKQKDISEIILRSYKTALLISKPIGKADWMGLNVDCQQVHPES
jgi:transposase